MAKRKRHDDHMLLADGETVRGISDTYVVQRVVGAGAFGAVYYAIDPTKPGREVALKEFFGARHPREQAMLKDLWERERVVGVQASPHSLMPTFYEAFSFDGHYYIAQEFIEGQTLDDIIRKRSPLPREWCLKWSVCLCDSLAYLHSRGIIHHDLKPPNIRIGPQGHLTLLDFGAAQYFGKGHEKTPPTEMYGTEGYLPPELDADGRWVADVQTDIFALGCTLYEMIAGEPPDQEQINQRSMWVTQTLMEMPNADLGLINLVNRALSYNKEYRFASMNEFLLELKKIAPPVLLVNKKHVRFGDIPLGQHTPPQAITIYNAGGGELRGDIKPRSPWIGVAANTFTGNKKDINLVVHLAKVPERETLQTGQLEINCPTFYDYDGNVISSGDRWFIDVSVRVKLGSGVLQVLERPRPDSPPIVIQARRGSPAVGQFVLKNIGEQSTQFKIDLTTPGAARTALIAGQTVTPDYGTIEPGQEMPITINVATADLVTGVHANKLYVRTSANQNLTVPTEIHVLSPIDFIKSKISGRLIQRQ